MGDSCFFEAVSLHLITSILFLVLSPLELLYPPNKFIRIPWSFLNVTRLMTSVIMLGNAVISQYRVMRGPHIDYGIMMTLMMITLSHTWLIIMMMASKQKGHVRQAAVWIFAFSSLMSSIVYHATGILPAGSDHWNAYTDIVLHSTLLLLTSFADSYELHEDSKSSGYSLPPQDAASFPSSFLFLFVTPLVRKGWKKSLELKDLFPLSRQDAVKSVAHRFIENLIKTNDVAVALILSFKSNLLQQSVSKFLSDMSDLSKALTLKWLMTAAESNNDSSSQSYWTLSLFIAANCISSLIFNVDYRLATVTAARMRSALRSAIYRKALRMSSSSRRDRSVGQMGNLMAVDCDKLDNLTKVLNTSWTAIIQIGIGFYMLYNEMGDSALVGLVTALVLIALNTLLLSKTKSHQQQQFKKRDERIRSMNETLTGIKIVKLYAWEEAIMRIIRDLRDSELKSLRILSIANAIVMFLYKTSPTLVAVATFGSYLAFNPDHQLTVAKVLFSFSLFNTLKVPLMDYPAFVKELTNFLVRRKRLNNFFSCDDILPYVKMNNSTSALHVKIRGAMFSWQADASDQLFHLEIENVEVEEGSMVSVVGAVGSGKSSFIAAILGEMHLLRGDICMSSKVKKIAYVPQQAWILNDTVRNNIVFGCEYDAEKYNKIIKACELEPDLLILSSGDMTEIGEKGINLSGGQRQRISIARAVYADADLYLFDDPLSAVDSHVAKSLFNNVVCGLLNGKTRILVTNNLSVLPDCAAVYVMKDGRVQESGSFRQIMDKSDSLLHQLMQSFTHQVDISDKGCDDASPHPADRSLLEQQITLATKFIDPALNVSPECKSKLIEQEAVESGKIKLTVYSQYFKQISTWILITVMLTLILSQVLEVYGKMMLSEWHGDAGDSKEHIMMYTLVGGLSAAFTLIGCLCLAHSTVSAAQGLHEMLLHQVMRSPMSFFETTPMGRILNRFSKDMDGLDVWLPYSLLRASSYTLMFAGSMFVIVMSIPYIVIGMIPVTVAFFFIQIMCLKCIRQVRREESRCCSLLFSHFSESFSGSSAIRAYDRSHDFIDQAEKLIDNHQLCTIATSDLNRWRSMVMQSIGILVISILAFAAIMMKGSEESHLIGLALTYAIQLANLSSTLLASVSMIESEMISAERVLEYAENPTEAEWHTDAVMSEGWPDKGSITFKEYATRYRPDLDRVLDDVNVKIKSGEKIGIVGRTGAGKSSIVVSLFRLIESCNGCIMIDGQDISQIGLHDLRSRLTVIPQESFLMSGTVRKNLDPFDRHSDDQLWECLRVAHLSRHIKSLTNQLYEVISEGGENMSIGQRQLMCLARAVLKKGSKILVLDEATAAVDAQTDALIQQTIRSQFSHCTILTIAHRINTIMDSDRILVLHEGRVVEFDSPSNLLRRSDSLFSSLARDAGIRN